MVKNGPIHLKIGMLSPFSTNAPCEFWFFTPKNIGLACCMCMWVSNKNVLTVVEGLRIQVYPSP